MYTVDVIKIVHFSISLQAYLQRSSQIVKVKTHLDLIGESTRSEPAGNGGGASVGGEF